MLETWSAAADRFCSKQVTGVLRDFIDEKAHLRLRWLIIRLQPVEGETFRRARADGTDDRGAEAFIKRFGVAHAFSHEKQMRDLSRIHKEDNVDMPVGEGENSLAQRLNILRQRPLINQKAGNGDAFLRQRRKQFWIRSAVFLYGDIHALKRGTKIGLQRGHQRAPGKRFRRNHSDGNLQLAECAGGLRPTGGNLDRTESREKLFAVIMF